MLSINDKDKFINDGPLFEKYPDLYPLVTRYERTDVRGNIVESWERFDDGRMHEVTQRDKLREELRRLAEDIDKMQLQEAMKDVT